MRIICTYGSPSQDPADSEVPVFQRYVSPRIKRVHELARLESTQFCVLSGELGLVDWNQRLPLSYCLLRADGVPRLVETVRQQLQARGISRIDYYCRSTEMDPLRVPYLEAIREACKSAGAELYRHTLEEPANPPAPEDWDEITEMAAEARETLASDSEKGNGEFEVLLRLYPADGMVYFQRGIGYETIGDLELAKADYEKARTLLILPRWRDEAGRARDRVTELLAAGGAITEALRRIKGLSRVDRQLRVDAQAAISSVNSRPQDAATGLRKCLEYLLASHLEQLGMARTGDLYGDINAWATRSSAPKVVRVHMHTIRSLGNLGAHESGEPPLQAIDIYPSATALVAILDWTNSQS
jgi:tetratricopeptide (TPR) repeat protein